MTRCAPVITHNKQISTPPKLAGFFFYLASAEGAGLLFYPATIQPHTSVYSGIYSVHAELYRPRHKTPCRALQALFPRFVPFYRRKYQTDTSGYNTTCATLERITMLQHLQHMPRWTLHRTAQPPYYNKVYIRVQMCPPVIDPCQTVQHIANHASPAASRCFPRLAACDLAPVSSQGVPNGTIHPAGQSSSRGRGVAARNHWRLLPHLFLGFRPITNKGEQ